MADPRTEDVPTYGGRNYQGIHHAMAVSRLVSAGAQRNGFRQKLLKTYARLASEADDPGCPPGCTSPECAAGHLGPERGARFEWLTVRPDAFIATPDKLTVYEVEVTNRCSRSKLSEYVELFWALDASGIAFRLVLVDAHGREMDLDMLEVELTLRREAKGG